MEPIVADMEWGVKSPRFPPNLRRDAAATHIGFALAWAIKRNLLNDAFTQAFPRELEEFSALRLTGPQMLVHLGGIIHSSWLNGNAGEFLAAYCRKTGRYVHDYVQRFPNEVYASRSMFTVPDTWPSMEKVLPLFDRRFDAWKSYPPAARSIFDGRSVVSRAYYPLELVVHAAILPLARELSHGQPPTLAATVLTALAGARPPLPCYCLDPTVAPVVACDVDATLKHLKSSLATKAICAFAVAFPKAGDRCGLAAGIEVIAQHQQSGPHRVWSPYSIGSDGRIVFEQPVVCSIAKSV